MTPKEYYKQSIEDLISEQGTDYPLSMESVERFYQFIMLLPVKDWPSQQYGLGIDPDGELSFEWYVEPRHTLSCSINPNGDIAYAWLSGDHSGHGAFRYPYSDAEELLMRVRRLTDL